MKKKVPVSQFLCATFTALRRDKAKHSGKEETGRPGFQIRIFKGNYIWIYCFELYVLKLNKEHMKTAGVDLGKGQIFKIKTKVTEMKTLIDIGKT